MDALGKEFDITSSHLFCICLSSIFSKTGVNYLLSEVTDFPNLISILHILFYYVTWILNSCQLYCQKWKINLNSFYKQTIWGTHIVKKIHLWAETSYQKLFLSSCCCSFSTHIFFWLIFEIMLTRKNKIEDKICNQQFTFYDVYNIDLIYTIGRVIIKNDRNIVHIILPILYVPNHTKSNKIQFGFSWDNPNFRLPQWNMFIATKWQEMISGQVGLLHSKSNANQSPSK